MSESKNCLIEVKRERGIYIYIYIYIKRDMAIYYLYIILYYIYSFICMYICFNIMGI